MRADRAAFHAFLLAVRTWNEIAFRAGHEMNDQAYHPGRRNPAEDCDELGIFGVTRLRIFHDPDGGKDPRADGQGDAEKIGNAARDSQARRAGRGGSGSGRIFRTDCTRRARRSGLRQEIGGQEKKWQGSDRSLHGSNA